MKDLKNDPFYSSLQEFTILTSLLIIKHEFRHLEACFRLIDKLLTEGEAGVKYTIMGNFIPSMHTVLDHFDLRASVIDLMPSVLRQEYIKQSGESDLESDLRIKVFKVWLN